MQENACSMTGSGPVASRVGSQYEGKTVVVSGKITRYRGKLEIIVTNVSQIIIK
jgi:hypothetical protein